MVVLGAAPGLLRLRLADADFVATVQLQSGGAPTPWPAGTVAWLHLAARGTGWEATWPATVDGSLLRWNVPAAQVAEVPAGAWAELWLDLPTAAPFIWLKGPVTDCGPAGLGTTAAVPTVPDAVAVPVPGPPGPPGAGSGGVVQRIAAHALSGHRLVVPTDTGTVEYADAANPDHLNRPVWLTVNAWASGALADLVDIGIVTESSWSWVPGQPLLMGLGGAIVQNLPDGAVFLRRIGEVVSPNEIEFHPDDPTVLAA